ncbi:polysaccharide lyase family 8 super-sandwich domain-containing protein [Caviibacter abscessus]|uniref:polysaccharide lyase family 8 super-sandwich domain-containing protein n=1 Tax=Caviibacter abscessus TaxID=1766719 RepID=UPI0008381FD7|nr:polysaccharide lyase family 8 super-sandwich domain-containing protein [Caviibacter abscessus]
MDLEIISKRKKYLIDEKSILTDKLENNAQIAIENLKNLDNLSVNDMKLKYNSILDVCKAYSSFGTKYFNKEEILKYIVDKIKTMRVRYYNLSSVEHTNWWQWEIGIPSLLNDIFVLIGDKCIDEMKKNLEVSHYFQSDERYSGNNPVAIHPTNNPFRESTGGNRVDTVKISFLRAALLKENLKKPLKALSVVWNYNYENGTLKDGFYKDGSFIQHDTVPYNGTYGNVLLMGISEILYLISDTPLISELSYIDELINIIFNSFEPFFYNGIFPDMLSGRAIDRKDSSDYKIGHMIISSLLIFNEFLKSGEHKEKLEHFITREIKNNKVYDFFENENSAFIYELGKKLLDKNIIVKEYEDNIKISNTMSRIFIRNENFSIGIAMHSDKVSNFETMNGENEKAGFTGDGMYYLYTKDGDLTYLNYWNNVDHKFIAGTTEIFEDEIPTTVRLSKNTKFAGSIKYGYKSLTYMDYYNYNDKLHSNKLWIFLENKLLFLEYGINNINNTYTTIDNRKYTKLPDIYIENEKISYEINKKYVLSGNMIRVNDIIYEFIEKDLVYFTVFKRDIYYFVTIYNEYTNKNKLVWLLNLTKQKNDENIEIEYIDKGVKVKHLCDTFILKENEYIKINENKLNF